MTHMSYRTKHDMSNIHLQIIYNYVIKKSSEKRKPLKMYCYD